MTDTQSELLAARINTGINFTKKLTFWSLITMITVGPVGCTGWYFYDLDQHSREHHAIMIQLKREYCDLTSEKYPTRMRYEKMDTITDRLNAEHGLELPTGLWTKCDIEEKKAIDSLSDSLKLGVGDYEQLLKQYRERERKNKE